MFCPWHSSCALKCFVRGIPVSRSALQVTSKGAFGIASRAPSAVVSCEVVLNGPPKQLCWQITSISPTLERFDRGEAAKGQLPPLCPTLCQGCTRMGPAERRWRTDEADVGAKAMARRRPPAGRRWGIPAGKRWGVTLRAASMAGRRAPRGGCLHGHRGALRRGRWRRGA